jgi:N-acetylglucosamine kinase-like BadF-type ATPase
MSRYVLGVDGGGTKTHVVIVDEGGCLCGTGLGGPSNYDDVGVAAARAGIGQAVDAARQAAGLAPAPFTAAFLGMAGVVSPQDRDVIRGIAQDLELAPPERVGVDHDCRVALAGGLTGRPGIVLIAGTGSSCYGRNAAGEDWRAGGWGHLISDEGSSYWLGVQAMQLAVRAFDGRSGPTPVMDRVYHQLGLAHMNGIMHHLYVAGMSRAEIASLAPLVIDAARGGDPASLALIQRGTQDLADCVLAVARRLDLADGPCELVLVGGLFRAGDIFVQPLREAVWERLPHCRITFPELLPELGACLLALQMLDITIDDTTVQALQRGAAQIQP